jgi:NAD(P)H dehydrogenase (quinone)
VKALARDPEQAADLAAQGIEIRKGDYFDYRSLLNNAECA